MNMIMFLYMKKILFVLAMGLLLASCDPVERDINRLERMTADAQANGASFTTQQWEMCVDEFEDICDDLKERQQNLTPDDIARISKASVAFANTLVRQTTQKLLDADGELNDDIDDCLERVGEALDEEYLSRAPVFYDDDDD